MRFGTVPVAEAEGAVLAHSLMLGRRKMPKGRVLSAADLAAITGAGIAEIVVARLDPGDVGEDRAAEQLSRAMVPDPAAAHLRLTAPQKGRVNFHATGPGVVGLDPAAIRALNLIDPALTLAVLPAFARVAAGTMVATVKVITYAVAEAALARAVAEAEGALRVRPVVMQSAGLILTDAPGQAKDLGPKAEEAVRTRLSRLGMDLAEVVAVPHEEAEIAAALARLKGDLSLILTGAATSDSHDVAPEGLRRAGGTVARFGMPVDPGNLLFYGALGNRPVIGLPGCARSPALNGADWVLERIACGIMPDAEDIAGMGVGGLLKEIPIRPEPRDRRG
ncbi:MAG TPA: molybdopterin-binding protein [Albidovulum sp.]|uniref:molybdopterin-binding protein n=1 Tax=Albidovulum sp. TaxID=1872424 RepID=UPI002CD8EFF8|nr:molybdopterin-binding protein [Albidovulum sp.]